jgi:hypothetical protein
MEIHFIRKKEYSRNTFLSKRNKDKKYYLLDLGQGHIEALILISIFAMVTFSSFKIYYNLNSVEEKNIKVFKRRWELLNGQLN